MASRPHERRPLRERLTGTPRLVLAALLLGAGTLVALTATSPPALGPAVVAARAVTAGATLAAADLTVVRRPTADLPDSALTDPAPALGHRVVAALARGEIVTSLRLAPQGLATGLAPGRATTAVTVSAGRAGVVTVGDTVRLVRAADSDPSGFDDSSATTPPLTLSDDARVLAVWPDPGGETTTLVVDVDVGSASRLAVLPGDLLVGFVVVTA